MCGFIVVKSSNTVVDLGGFNRGLQSLERRGPDGNGAWISPDGNVAMGHTRLSIIDIAGGAQPIANEDESIWSVVNGEFYEHDTILNQLRSRGHKTRSSSDSEMLVHLYEEMGKDCLKMLRGEFAFVLFDRKDKRLFAARDRFGIKPIYYAVLDDKVYIASEVKAILAAGVPASWDEESLYDSFHIMPRQDRTIFRHVKQIPPGHYLIADESGLRIEPYWDVNFSTALSDETVCMHELERLLTESVRIRTRADVPIACYLSGGVDSSTVLGLAQSFVERKTAAFTVSFDHADFDERVQAEDMAKFAGVDFHAVRVTDQDFADVFKEVVTVGEMFVFNSHAPARYILSKRVSDAGFKVALGGEGADEVFAGYEFLQTALRRHQSKTNILQMGSRLFSMPDAAERRIFKTSPFLGLMLRVIGMPDHLRQYMHEKVFTMKDMLSPEFEKQFKHYDPYYKFMRQFKLSSLRGKEKFRQLLYFWLKSAFVNYVLAGERLDMANGVELRLPFLDHRLFEYAAQIPGSLLHKNNINKYLLRHIAKPYVTHNIVSGAKKPFIGPSAMSTASPLYQLFQDTLRSQVAKDIPFINHQSLLKFLDETNAKPESERAKYDPLYFMLSSLVVLQDSYKMGRV